MASDEFPPEDELQSRQTTALYPVGRVLRQTWDAENHESLGTDLTGLMLQLARVDPDAEPLPRGAMPVTPAATPTPAAEPSPATTARPSWWRMALGTLKADRSTGPR